jgi:hypothetical protein
VPKKFGTGILKEKMWKEEKIERKIVKSCDIYSNELGFMMNIKNSKITSFQNKKNKYFFSDYTFWCFFTLLFFWLADIWFVLIIFQFIQHVYIIYNSKIYNLFLIFWHHINDVWEDPSELAHIFKVSVLGFFVILTPCP